MRKSMLLFLSLALALGAVLSGGASAADAVRDAYDAYGQTVEPLRRDLSAKQAELDALYESGQRDDAKAQQLFKDMGEIEGKLFVAETELRDKLKTAAPAADGGVMTHHYGEFRHGEPAPRMGMRHGGGHGGSMRHGGHDGYGRQGGYCGGWDW